MLSRVWMFLNFHRHFILKGLQSPLDCEVTKPNSLFAVSRTFCMTTWSFLMAPPMAACVGCNDSLCEFPQCETKKERRTEFNFNSLCNIFHICPTLGRLLLVYQHFLMHKEEDVFIQDHVDSPMNSTFHVPCGSTPHLHALLHSVCVQSEVHAPAFKHLQRPCTCVQSVTHVSHAGRLWAFLRWEAPPPLHIKAPPAHLTPSSFLPTGVDIMCYLLFSLMSLKHCSVKWCWRNERQKCEGGLSVRVCVCRCASVCVCC